MNSEQKALKNYLDNNNVSWAKMTVNDRKLLKETLRPNGPFTVEQTELLQNRWLGVTDEQVSQINTLLPIYTKVPVVTDLLGRKWLPGNLLTDCMQPGDTYAAAAEVLGQLVLTYKNPKDFDLGVVNVRLEL